MKQYIDLAFQREKKPMNMEKLWIRVEKIIQKENEGYHLSDSDKKEIEHIVSKGTEDFDYYQTPHDKYTLLRKTSFRKGRFYGQRSGNGFVVCVHSSIKEGKEQTYEEKIPIRKEYSNGAIDGDSVLIDIVDGKSARVLRVLERNLEAVTGEVVRIGGSYYLKPLDKKKQFITIALEGEQVEGMIVSATLKEQTNTDFYIAEVVNEFRHKDDPFDETLLEAFKCGMPEGFCEESMKQVHSIPSFVREEDKRGRNNFTGWNVFSIDGADTKDKDDAISIKKMYNGHYVLGVHISDVSYYVPKGSALEKDAFRKGTSYYFGGSVEPMFPHALSNGICSLHDGVDRLTKSMIMEFDEEGNYVQGLLVPSVIHSRRGLTYTEVNQLLQRGICNSSLEPYVEDLLLMDCLAKKLRNRREQEGAIEFNRPELNFVHDENGFPYAVKNRYQMDAENMIEEFMLAANVQVGKILEEEGLPCVYRVHGLPNEERLTEFLRLLDAIDLSFPYSSYDILEDKSLLQQLANHVQNSGKLSNVLTTHLIRCMSHAGYSTKNIGHYGTGFDLYCHFTSPIRRLADYSLSQIIDDCYFEKDPEKKEKNKKEWITKASSFAIQASKMERVEEEVEKKVLAMETGRYFQKHIHEVFEGTVVSVGRNGLLIQLDNLLEGMVRMRNLSGDYVYNPETFTLLSMDERESYYMGDRLKLRLVSSDPKSAIVDFKVLEKVKENPIIDPLKSNQKVKAKRKQEKIFQTYSIG